MESYHGNVHDGGGFGGTQSVEHSAEGVCGIHSGAGRKGDQLDRLLNNLSQKPRLIKVLTAAGIAARTLIAGRS